MKRILQFESNKLSIEATETIKGGFRFFTQSEAVQRNKRRQLREQGKSYTCTVRVCPITRQRTHCVEW